MALFGVNAAFSSAASCWQSFSASGSLVKVLLQDELRSDGIYAFSLNAAQTALGFHRGEALVDAFYRQVKVALQLAGKALYTSRERMLAVGCDRQSNHQLGGAPLGHQSSDAVEAGRGDRRQRMRSAQLRLADCHSNTL